MTVADCDVLDLCAGPGGWEVGAEMLDPALHARMVGIEIDDAACATREIAGHRTVQGDVSTIDPLDFAGIVGLLGSPPCTMFSQAGKGVGRRVLDLLTRGVLDLMAGNDTRAQVRAAIYPVALVQEQAANAKRKPEKRLTEEQVAAKAEHATVMCALVLEPARWFHALEPSLEWLALEQVPQVLPVWKVYARALREAGWSAWCGILNSADYGVPQTRTRAILIARKHGAAQPPEPTHAEGGEAESLFGAGRPKWVSMAEALGWTGRTAVGFPRVDDRGDSPDGYRERDWRDGDEPSFALTEKARSWTVRTGANQALTGPGDREGPWRDRTKPYERSADEPAPTVDTKAGTAWQLHEIQAHGAVRDADEPAPTLTASMDNGNFRFRVNTGRDWKEGGSREDAQSFDAAEQPAPAIDTKGRWHVQVEGELPWAGSVNDQTGTEVDLEWPLDTPATTIATRGLVPHPGANNNRFNDSTKSRNDGIRITLQQAAVLQSFDPAYPWQGTMSKTFQQVGNAVPPMLAGHVLAAALGRRFDHPPITANLPPIPVVALRNNNQGNAAERTLDEPAGTLFFGERVNVVEWTVEGEPDELVDSE